jgi:hypothetical protein
VDLVVYPCDELQNSKARNVYRSNTVIAVSRRACGAVCVCVCVCLSDSMCAFLCGCVCVVFFFFAVSYHISTDKIS